MSGYGDSVGYRVRWDVSTTFLKVVVLESMENVRR